MRGAHQARRNALIRHAGKAIRGPLSLLGLELTGPPWYRLPYRLRRRTRPAGVVDCDLVRGAVWVDLDRVVSAAWFTFTAGGWHPYVATLEQYLDRGEQDPYSTPLHGYYEAFQPLTVQEALFLDEPSRLPFVGDAPAWRLARIWTLPRAAVRRRPSNSTDVAVTPVTTKPPNSDLFGPISMSYLRNKYSRLLRVYHSLSDHGYRPRDFRDSLVEGYFLIRGDDYRFVPTEGQHRLAAFRLLGVRRFAARASVSYPTVNFAKLHRWTLPRGGPMPPEIADRLFAGFFAERSRERARKLGLLSPATAGQ